MSKMCQKEHVDQMQTQCLTIMHKEWISLCQVILPSLSNRTVFKLWWICRTHLCSIRGAFPKYALWQISAQVYPQSGMNISLSLSLSHSPSPTSTPSSLHPSFLLSLPFSLCYSLSLSLSNMAQFTLEFKEWDLPIYMLPSMVFLLLLGLSVGNLFLGPIQQETQRMSSSSPP